MNKSRKTKVAGKDSKKSRHYEPPSNLEAEALTMTNSHPESPSWFYLLWNLSMETALSTSTFDRVVEKALEMLKSDDSNMGSGQQTRSLAVQELRKTLKEREILAKQGRLNSLLTMLQTSTDNLWNKPPGSLSLITQQSNELQRPDLYTSEAAIFSEFGTRGTSNSVQPLHNSMSARSSLTREIVPANTDSRELNSLLAGLGKHPTPNQMPGPELDTRATDLNNFIYGFSPFLKPPEYPQGKLEIPPTLTGAQTPVGILPAQNWTDTSCFRALTSYALPPQPPAARSVPQGSPFAWNDSTSPAPDLNHAMHRILDLTLCNPAAYIADPASAYISPLDSRDVMNWPDQRLQAVPLSIPSASQGISDQLTPPRISTDDGQETPVNTTNATLSIPSPFNQDHQGVRQNGVSDEEKNEDKSMSLVVLTNAVLLSSGDRRCLIVPTDSQNAESAVNLTESDMEMLINKGAAIPLSQVTAGDQDCLTTKNQHHSLESGGAETGSLSGNDNSSQTPRSCFEASDGTPLPLNFTPIKGLSDILGKPILNMGKPSAGTSPSVGSSLPFFNFERRARPNSQQLPSRHQEKEEISTRNEKRKFVKCLIRSKEVTQGQQNDIFNVSGFVENYIWSQLPAIVGVTSYEDTPNVLNWFGNNELVDLHLDRIKDSAKGEENICRLYRKQLALMSHQLDFVMALVPTLLEQGSYDLKVFIKIH